MKFHRINESKGQPERSNIFQREHLHSGYWMNKVYSNDLSLLSKVVHTRRRRYFTNNIKNKTKLWDHLFRSGGHSNILVCSMLSPSKFLIWIRNCFIDTTNVNPHKEIFASSHEHLECFTLSHLVGKKNIKHQLLFHYKITLLRQSTKDRIVWLWWQVVIATM